MTISIAISCEQDELPALQAALAAFGSGAKPLERELITEEQRTKILDLHKEGLGIQDIKAGLGLKNGRQISGIIFAHDMALRQKAKSVRALQEAKAEQPEKAQVLGRKEAPKAERVTGDRKVAIDDHPPNLQKASKKDEKIPLTEEQKAAILRMKASGKGAKEIAKALGIPDARRVNGMIMLSKRQKAKPPGTPASGSTPAGGSQGQQNVNVAERISTPENVDPVPMPQQDPGMEAAPAPEAKPYTRAALNGLIWDLHRAGKNNEEISDELYKRGYCFSEDFVRERLKKIEEGRA